jgi:penicillin-binding protein 1A
MKKTLIIASILLLTGILAATGFILSIYFGAFGHLPDQPELLHYKNKTATQVLAENGELIGRYFVQNRTNTSYSQLPGHLVDALVATEDARFFEHTGIDSRSVLRVMIKSVLFSDPDAGGGSTITQQLVKNMYGRKSYGFVTMPVNKIREALIAHRLEKVCNKEEILALYLNTVSFGENLYGIESAALRYFHKNTFQLRVEESAVLVGLLKANTTYNPRLYPESSKARRNVVVMQMAKYGYLSPAEADSVCALPLETDYANLESGGPADYFLVTVKKDAERVIDSVNRATGKAWNIEEDGLIVRTTLDINLQRYALEAIALHLPAMQDKLREQYAKPGGQSLLQAIDDTIGLEDVILQPGLFAMDPSTGAIKAWVGGIHFQEYPYDQVLARRQLASSFKPVVYAAALEKGIRPCQYLDNNPVHIEGYEGWSPENYDHSTGGRFSLANALAHSMNIPTVNLFLKTGFDQLEDMWIKMGFTYPLYRAPSVALGTGEASVLELAVGYAAFANGGYRVKPVSIVSIEAPDGRLLYQAGFPPPDVRIMAERTSILMRLMLQKAVREGTGASMAGKWGLTYPWAGKTGTSQDFSDAWFCTFNPRLVMATRVGAFTPGIHFNQGASGSGAALALPLVALTLKRVETNPVEAASLLAPFPDSTGFEEDLDCPDSRRETIIDRVRDIFKVEKMEPDREKTMVEKTPPRQVEPARKKSIFDIFKKKKQDGPE